MSDSTRRVTVPIRREPPRFRQVTVRAVEHVTPRLVRVTLAGPELAELAVDDPAASVRILLPSPGTDALVMPTWNGNEFLLPDGRRPTLRTFTPRRVDADVDAGELDIDIVVHGAGVASGWAATAGPGAPAAISGPGRGYAVPADAREFVLAGDETAIPALIQVIDALPDRASAQVVIEVAQPDARLSLPDRPHTSVTWCDLPAGAPPGDALVAAVRTLDVSLAARVWAAGEAAAVQRLRRHFFEERSLPRLHATIRGYWKHGRGGDTDD